MSPRTASQFEKIREEKKALIMEVALEHFAGKGYHATTISHIAKQAGISKGLLYNYFEGKEELLSEIIRTSVAEVYTYFDIDRDGTLSEEEFEFFIREVTQVLREKKEFWRLFLQLMMQSEVRSHLLNFLHAGTSQKEAEPENREDSFLPSVAIMVRDYFLRLKEKKGPDYDPEMEMNLFIMTLKGFAVTFIYSEDDDDENFDKCIDAVVRRYK